MKKVSNILLRKGNNITTVLPETSVLEALQIMADQNIGSVVVMKSDRFMGIMTERDYSRKVVLKGKSSTDTTVADIMSTDFPSVSPDDSIEHCMELMSANTIRYLPVYDNDALSGIISMNDVVKETILAQQQAISDLHSYIHSSL
jgi:CBS domain-containing protein